MPAEDGRPTDGTQAADDTDLPDGTADAADPAPAVEHDPQGLDLARSIGRAYAARTPVPGRRRRSGGGAGGGQPGAPGRRRPVTGTRASGAHPDERDPQLLDGVLGRMVAEYGWSADLAVHGAFARWAEIVGDEVAQHCTPVQLVDGELRVEASSTAWATQVRMLSAQLVRRMAEELGDGVVLKIDVRGPQAPSWSKGSRRVQGRGPRDTYG